MDSNFFKHSKKNLTMLKKIKFKHHDSYCQWVEALIEQSRKQSSLGFPNLPSVKLSFVAAFAYSVRVNC